MEIYVLRHGIAEQLVAGRSDAERTLTGEGRRKLREVLAAAKRAGVTLDLILTSPYVRAFQTAEIAAEVLGYRDEPLHTGALTPDGDPHAVWDELRLHKPRASVLLASHEPLVSRLVAYLLAAPGLQVEMKKGALVRIDAGAFGAQPRCALKWMLVPKLVC